MLADDDEALAVATEAGARMGEGLALLVDALNPQLIVPAALGARIGDVASLMAALSVPSIARLVKG
jgi:hypothetical protein